MAGTQHPQFETGLFQGSLCALKRDKGLCELFADHEAPTEGEEGPWVVGALGWSSGKEPSGDGLGADWPAIAPGEEAGIGGRRRGVHGEWSRRFEPCLVDCSVDHIVQCVCKIVTHYLLNNNTLIYLLQHTLGNNCGIVPLL